MTMEHTIDIRVRDISPIGPHFVAVVNYSANPNIGSVSGRGKTLWSAVADALVAAHTDMFGRYDANDWR